MPFRRRPPLSVASSAPHLHLRNRRFFIRAITILSNLFSSLQDSSISSNSSNATSVVCLRELHIFTHKVITVLNYCSQSGRIWLITKTPQLSGEFYELSRELSTILDVLPIKKLEICLDVKEQVELLKKQCGRSGIFVEEGSEERIRRRIYSCFERFGRAEVPECSELRELFVDKLGITDARACVAEIEFLEKQIAGGGEEVNLSVLGGCVALVRYCRFLLFGFQERCFDVGSSFVDYESSKSSGDCSVVTPKDFCCPISLDLMKDPVVVSTGQTYDRVSIMQWIEGGHRNCPNSGQILSSCRFVPNIALRNLISQWCAENEVPYDSLDNAASVDNMSIACSSKAAIEVNRALAKLLIRELVSGSDNAKTVAARELRLLAKIGIENRAVIAQLGAIPLLCGLLLSPDCIAQENAVTAILNLSIHDGNKCRIMEEEGCLKQLVYVLRYGLTTEARENAAATLFSLSAVHEYKLRIINEQGAVAALANLLMEGSTRGKKDAVMALFNISTHPDSWSYMLDFGAVSALVGVLRNEGVAEEAAGALALLVKQSMVAEMVGNEDTALTNLVGLMRRGTPKGKENAVAALQEMCKQGGLLVMQRVARMPALHGLMQNVLFTGTKRARRKAALLAKMCQRSELASSATSNMTATGGWPIDHTLTRTGSISLGSGEVVSVPMVPVL